ncbi:MAG: signal peptidase I [bacterium]|nr:signal peptidase I [bacterium]
MRKSAIRLLWFTAILVVVAFFVFGVYTVPTVSMSPTVIAGDLVIVNRFRYGISTWNSLPIVGYVLPYYKLVSFSSPKRGDVVVYAFPGQRDEVLPRTNEIYMKRCIALAGDTIRIVNDTVYVNGKRSLSDSVTIFTMSVESRKMRDESDQYRLSPAGKDWTPSDYGPLRIPRKGDIINLVDVHWSSWGVFIAREGHNVNERTRTIDGVVAKHYVVERDYIFCMGDNRDNSMDSRFTGFVPEDNVFGSPICALWNSGSDAPRDRRYSEGQQSYPRLVR